MKLFSKENRKRSWIAIVGMTMLVLLVSLPSWAVDVQRTVDAAEAAASRATLPD